MRCVGHKPIKQSPLHRKNGDTVRVNWEYGRDYPHSPSRGLDPCQLATAVLEEWLFKVNYIVILRSSRKYLLRPLKNEIPPEMGETYNEAGFIDSIVSREDEIVSPSLRNIIDSGT